jgi:dihydrolipoyl dehydrogenase
MDVDVAVLGGGPGGYSAAIRAAQLGAKVACIEKEEELGGTCLRVGCIPTKAWVQTAFALKEAEESFDKFGVSIGEASLDFAKSNEWKAAVVKQMTNGVASLFKANGVEWVKGSGRFKDASTIAVEGGEDVSFRSAIIATGSYPLRPPIEGIDSARCVDSTGLLAQTEVPGRLVVLGGGIIGCEFASIFRRFGSEVTIIEMLPTLIPAEDTDAQQELAKQFKKRGIEIHLESQCSKVEENGDGLTVHFGDGQTVECDLMLVATGRGPVVEDLGLDAVGIEFDRKKGIAADERRRTTSTRSATAPGTGSSPTPRSAKARSRPRTRPATTPSSTTAPCRARSTRTRRSPASGSRKRRRASSTATMSRSASSPGSRTRVPSCRTRPSAG